MRKQKWKKFGAGLLCMVLIFTNSIYIENHVSASGIETGEVDVEEYTDKDVIEEKDTEGTETSTEDVELGNEEEKVEGNDPESEEEKIECNSGQLGSGTQERDGEKEETEETEEKATDIEDGELENKEEKIEDNDFGESENKAHEKDGEEEDSIVNDLISEDEENQTELMAASGNIASGTYESIVWKIDGNGTLLVEGTGNFSTNTGSAQWLEYKDSIVSAEIKVKGMTNASRMFLGCSNLKSIDFSEFDTSDIGSMNDMFNGCSSLMNLDLSGFDTSRMNNMRSMFADCSNLVSLNLGEFDNSNVTSMQYMFSNCSSLVRLDLKMFGTGNVTNMRGMFEGCSSLTNLDVSGFDTKKVTSMFGMFSGCSSLTSLDISGFDTNYVTEMNEMFFGCNSLNELNLKGIDTSKVKGMYRMFQDCSNLRELDLSGFNTISLEESTGGMGYMFYGCTNLKSLDLSRFDMSNLASNTTGTMQIFYECNSLTKISVPYNVTVEVGLPGEASDIWYQSDGTIVTRLPQNLSYSVVLGKNYVPEESGTDIDDSTIGKIEIASNIKVSKDKSAVQILDAKTGEPVVGVRVWVGAEYWTDENGVVELNNTGPTTIQIEKDGYNKKTAKKRLVKGEPAVIVICPATGDVEILTACLKLAGEDEDVLNNTVYLSHRDMDEWEGNSATLTLTVESAGKPTKYQLIQNGKILQENTEGVFSLPGKYINHNDGSVSYYVDSFDAGYEVYIWVFDANGNWKTKKLGIRVSEESSLTMQIKEQNSKGAVNFGNDSLKVTIPSSVPIVGGSELDFGFSEKLPVAVNIDNSGKVKIALNMGNLDTGDSAGWYDKKQEYNNLANRAESLWNSAAAFGGTPSSFGAGMFSVKGNIIGYGEGYLDDSTDRLCVNVGVIASVSGEAKYTQYYFLAYIPVYITFGGGIEGKWTGGIRLSYKEGEFLINAGSLEHEVSPYAKLEGGVGADNILSIGAYGKLTLTWLHRYADKYNRVTLNGNGKIKATAFLWSKVLAEADFFNLVLHDDNSRQSRAYISQSDTYATSWLDMTGAELISMDYLDKRDTEAGASTFIMARASDTSSQRFLSYAYENASPQLVQVEDKLYLFYLDGVEGRKEQNQTALFYQYSADNGKTWAKAVRVDNGANETADSNFDVAVNGSDIYVIWSDAGKIYGDEITSMDSAEAIAQVAKEMDLMMAVIDSNAGTITTRKIATENADLQSQIAIGSDGTVYVAWITNDVSSEKGIFSNENQLSICYASSVENYTVHSTALSSKYYPLTLDVGMLGTEVYAVTDIDVDGDLNTQEDREIYTLNLSTGGSLSAQTSNSVTDSVPVFAKVVGKNCLFWYLDGNIAYTTDGQTVGFIFDEENLPAIGQEFSILEGNNGKAAVVWTATSLTEDAGVDMYCADFDGSSWSNAYKLDELDSEYTTSVSGYLDGSDYRIAYLGSIYEGEELYSHIQLCTPEDRMETSVMWYAETDGAEGQGYPICLLITNDGNVPVSTLSISSEDGSIQDTVTGLSIEPGTSYEFTWNGITLPEGMTDIYKCNLIIAAQGENASDSNIVDISVGEPDFSIEAYQDYSNGELFAGIIVTNQGILASDSLLIVYSDEAHTNKLYQTSLSDIAGGESGLTILDLTVLDETVRTFYFVVTDESGMELYSNNNETVLYVGKGVYSEDTDPDDGDDGNKGEETPKPEETESPKPEETENPKPEETENPKPEETESSKPEETESPKPEETESPKPEETASPKPEETANPSPEQTSAENQNSESVLSPNTYDMNEVSEISDTLLSAESAVAIILVVVIMVSAAVIYRRKKNE